MKIMGRSLLYYASLILLASCTRYQYATISSSNTTLSKDHEFVAENDTLLIRYNFLGRDAPVYLHIENKLNVPVYIDWRQSALIVNDKAVSYVPAEIPLKGMISTYSSNNRYSSYSLGSLDATASLPPSVDFIPPHSHIEKQPLGVTNRMVRGGQSDTAFKKVKVAAAEGGYYSIRQANYTEANSPVRFRSYLTFMIGEAGSKPLAYEHSFYVNELVNTGLNPQQYRYNLENRGDMYYIREVTGYGKAATGFGVIAGTAIITGAAAALEKNNGNCNNCKY